MRNLLLAWFLWTILLAPWAWSGLMVDYENSQANSLIYDDAALLDASMSSTADAQKPSVDSSAVSDDQAAQPSFEPSDSVGNLLTDAQNKAVEDAPRVVTQVVTVEPPIDSFAAAWADEERIVSSPYGIGLSVGAKFAFVAVGVVALALCIFLGNILYNYSRKDKRKTLLWIDKAIDTINATMSQENSKIKTQIETLGIKMHLYYIADALTAIKTGTKDEPFDIKNINTAVFQKIFVVYKALSDKIAGNAEAASLGDLFVDGVVVKFKDREGPEGKVIKEIKFKKLFEDLQGKMIKFFPKDEKLREHLIKTTNEELALYERLERLKDTTGDVAGRNHAVRRVQAIIANPLAEEGLLENEIHNLETEHFVTDDLARIALEDNLGAASDGLADSTDSIDMATSFDKDIYKKVDEVKSQRKTLGEVTKPKGLFTLDSSGQEDGKRFEVSTPLDRVDNAIAGKLGAISRKRPLKKLMGRAITP